MSTNIAFYSAMVGNLMPKNFILLRLIWQKEILKKLEELIKEVKIEISIIKR